MDNNKRFAELAGIAWCECKLSADKGWLICTCGARFSQIDALRGLADQHVWDKNPEFSDAREVLRALKEIGKMHDLVAYLNYYQEVDGDIVNNLIPTEYVLIPGFLRDAAIKWMAEQEKREDGK